MTATTRQWGDGANRRSQHVVEAINFSYPPLSVTCSDGMTIQRPTPASLNLAWEVHCGHRVEVEVAEQAVRETYRPFGADAELHEFMARITGNVAGLNPMSAQRDTADMGSSDDLDAAFDMLERLGKMQDACTCATTDILACPNYVAGDEEPLGGDE